MRTITAGMFITLDGVIEAPEKWNHPYYDEELNQAVMPQLAGAGLHLYGRRVFPGEGSRGSRRGGRRGLAIRRWRESP